MDCRKLWKKDQEGNYECMVFRAQYERKKDRIQKARYKEALEFAKESRAKVLTYADMKTVLSKHLEQLKNKLGRAYKHKIVPVLREEHGIKIGIKKATQLRTILQQHYPNEFAKAD